MTTLSDVKALPVIGFDYFDDGETVDRYHVVACPECGGDAMVARGFLVPHLRPDGTRHMVLRPVNIAVTCEVCGKVEVVPFNDPAWDATLRTWSPAYTPACSGCQHDEEWLDWWRFHHEP